MTRIAAVAAAAVALFATQASAAEVRVSLAGKSADQITSDLRVAARTVCAQLSEASPMFVGAYGRCVRETVKAAQDKLAAV